MKKRSIKKLKVIVDKNMRDYSQDPFVLKKLAMAKEFIDKNGLPKEMITSNKK